MLQSLDGSKSYNPHCPHPQNITQSKCFVNLFYTSFFSTVLSYFVFYQSYRTKDFRSFSRVFSCDLKGTKKLEAVNQLWISLCWCKTLMLVCAAIILKKLMNVSRGHRRSTESSKFGLNQLCYKYSSYTKIAQLIYMSFVKVLKIIAAQTKTIDTNLILQ